MKNSDISHLEKLVPQDLNSLDLQYVVYESAQHFADFKKKRSDLLDKASSDIKKVEALIKASEYQDEFIMEYGVYGPLTPQGHLAWRKDDHGNFRLMQIYANAYNEDEDWKPLIERNAHYRLEGYQYLSQFVHKLSLKLKELTTEVVF